MKPVTAVGKNVVELDWEVGVSFNLVIYVGLKKEMKCEMPEWAGGRHRGLVWAFQAEEGTNAGANLACVRNKYKSVLKE